MFIILCLESSPSDTLLLTCRLFVFFLKPGKAESMDREVSYAAATRLKDVGTSIYSLGLGFRDSTELDQISSKPLEDYRFLVNSGAEAEEVPGIWKYNMDNGKHY